MEGAAERWASVEWCCNYEQDEQQQHSGELRWVWPQVSPTGTAPRLVRQEHANGLQLESSSVHQRLTTPPSATGSTACVGMCSLQQTTCQVYWSASSAENLTQAGCLKGPYKTYRRS